MMEMGSKPEGEVRPLKMIASLRFTGPDRLALRAQNLLTQQPQSRLHHQGDQTNTISAITESQR